MGLKEVIQGTVKNAVFPALGNLKTTVTYRSKGVVSYVGGVVSSGDTDYTITNAVLVDFTTFEIDNVTILSTDRKLLIPSGSLTPTPKLTDSVVISSVEWQIHNMEIDPAEACWIFQIRKP